MNDFSSCDFPVTNPRFMLYFFCLFLCFFFVLIDWFVAAVVVVLLFLCCFLLLVIKPDMEGTAYMHAQKKLLIN